MLFVRHFCVCLLHTVNDMHGVLLSDFSQDLVSQLRLDLVIDFMRPVRNPCSVIV
jgi:hypothetical protein